MNDSWINRIPFFVLFILLLLGMIWAVVYCINDVYGNRPVVNVTNKIIDGDPTLHGQIYEVMIMDGVDPVQVSNALKLVSNQYGFVVIPWDESRVYQSPWNNFAQAPFPAQDESFLILMVPQDQYPTVPAAGWTVPPTGRITVLVQPDYPAPILSSIIEHECTHNVETVNKLDYPTNPVNLLEFEAWLSDAWMGPTWEPSENLWSSIRNDWQICEYLDGDEADHAEPQ